jgi:hypothetical protein
VKEEAARAKDKAKKKDLSPKSLYDKLLPLVQQIEDQMEERDRDEAFLAQESAERGEVALKALDEAKKLVATDATAEVEGAMTLGHTPPTFAATASARSSAQRSDAGAYNNSTWSSSRASSGKRARIDCTQVASSGFSDNEGNEEQQGEGAETRRDEEEPGHADADVDGDADADAVADAHVDAGGDEMNTRTTPMSGFKRRSSQQNAGNAEDEGDAQKYREQEKFGVNVHVLQHPEDSEQMQVQVQQQVQECDEGIGNQDKDKDHQENDSSQGNKLSQPKAISNSQQRLLEQDTPKGRGNNRLTKSQSHSQSQGNKSNDTTKAFYSQDAAGTWTNVPIRHSHQQTDPAMVVVEDAEVDINGAEEAHINDSVASTSVTSIQEQHGQHLLGGDSFDQ